MFGTCEKAKLLWGHLYRRNCKRCLDGFFFFFKSFFRFFSLGYTTNKEYYIKGSYTEYQGKHSVIMIKAENLIKTFVKNEKKNKKTEFNAVDGISLTAGKGEIVGILGPNGAGKTTLLRMLSSLMKPTSGTVTISLEDEEAAPITDPVELRRHIGYHSGNTRLYGRLSAREMLTMFGTIYGLSDDVISERVQNISDILNMEAFIDNRIEKLSTGQTQRAAIARCLIHDPEIYIFDEPTLGLDIISSAAITKFMKGEKDRGRTVIYSTHYMEEAENLCDRIMMINRGRIICDLSPDELKSYTGTDNMRDAFSVIVEREELDHEE